LRVDLKCDASEVESSSSSRVPLDGDSNDRAEGVLRYSMRGAHELIFLMNLCGGAVHGRMSGSLRSARVAVPPVCILLKTDKEQK
jgi:hypothetical protein